VWLEKLCLEKVGAIALIKPSFIAIVRPFNLHLMKQINHGRNLKSKAFDSESEPIENSTAQKQPSEFHTVSSMQSI
jgi:hypothetical protein